MPDLASTVAGTATIGGTSFPVVSWTVDGDLVGDLPAQVRTISGSAITQASITLAAPEGETAGWWSPWRRDALEGSPVTVAATVDGTDTVVFVGTVVRHTGDTSSPTATFTCYDLADRLHRPVTIPAVPAEADGWLTPGLEPQWLIDRVARTGGFHQTAPLPSSGTLAAGTLAGSCWPEVGTLTATNTPTFGPAPWGPALTGGGGSWRLDRPHILDGTVYVQASLADGGHVTLKLWDGAGSDDAPGHIDLTIAGGTFTVGGVAAGPAPADGHVTVRLERAAGGVDVVWDGGTGTIAYDPDDTLTVFDVTFGGTVGGIVVCTGEPEPWTVTSDLDVGLGVLDGIPALDTNDGWQLVRDVAEAEQGAVWVDRQGIFHFRNRHTLRGIGAVPVPVTSTDRIVSVGWTVDDTQRAGTVEAPVVPTEVTVGLDEFGVAQQTVTVWEADRVVRINPQRTVRLTVDLDGSVVDLDGRLRRGVGSGSFYRANTRRDGQGTSVALQTATAVQVGTSKARITLRNTSGARLWLVDSAGQPSLRLAGRVRIDQAEPLQVTVDNTTGHPTVLTLPSSPWRQDPTSAETLARWLAAETAAPLPQLSDVEVVADLDVDRGAIVRLTDDHATALDEAAVVIGVRLEGSAGTVTQRLAVRVLQPTFAELTGSYDGATFSDLTDLWAGRTFADFNRRPLEP